MIGQHKYTEQTNVDRSSGPLNVCAIAKGAYILSCMYKQNHQDVHQRQPADRRRVEWMPIRGRAASIRCVNKRWQHKTTHHTAYSIEYQYTIQMYVWVGTIQVAQSPQFAGSFGVARDQETRAVHRDGICFPLSDLNPKPAMCVHSRSLTTYLTWMKERKKELDVFDWGW